LVGGLFVTAGLAYETRLKRGCRWRVSWVPPHRISALQTLVGWRFVRCTAGLAYETRLKRGCRWRVSWVPPHRTPPPPLVQVSTAPANSHRSSIISTVLVLVRKYQLLM